MKRAFIPIHFIPCVFARLVVAQLLAAAMLFAVASGCRSSGSTDQPEDRKPRPATVPVVATLEQSRGLFYRAADGDSAALKLCIQSLNSLPPSESSSPLANAYRGGCDMLLSKDAPLPWDKGKLARSGLTKLDAAVAADPDNLRVRFVRGMTCYHLPAMFNRKKSSGDDLAIVAEQTEAAVADGRLAPNEAASALLYHGEFLNEAGDTSAARKAWRCAVDIYPDTRSAKRAMQKLATP